MMMQLEDKVRYWSENECFDPATREHASRMLDENNQKEMEGTEKKPGTNMLNEHVNNATNFVPRDAARNSWLKMKQCSICEKK